MLEMERIHPAQHSLDDSMIPAINIVFLLLIFFMIAGHIEARESLLRAPKSISQGEIAQDAVDIKLLGDGRQIIDGEVVEGELFDVLKAKGLGAESRVVCNVHRELNVSALDPLLESAHRLGVRQLQIVTEFSP